MLRRITAFVIVFVLCFISIGTVSADEGDKVEVSGIFLEVNTLSLRAGETYTLNYIAIPDAADCSGIAWRSANEAIVFVDPSGCVTAVASGTTTVICYAPNGVMATCEVTVEAPSAIEQLNEREYRLFQFLTTDPQIFAAYNVAAIRIRNIYIDPNKSVDEAYYIDIQGTNMSGATVNRQLLIWITGDTITLYDMTGMFAQLLKTELDTEVMDPEKINAALVEYWTEKGLL